MKWKNVLLVLCLFAFCGASIASSLAYLGALDYRLELLTHFRLQYLVAVVLPGLLLVFLQSRKWLLPWLFFGAITLWPLVPYYLPTAQPVSTNSAFRLMNANVLTANMHYSQLGRIIQDTKPDLICLQEVDVRWINGLAPFLKQWPYRLEVPQNDNFGLAFYSRLPLQSAQVVHFAVKRTSFSMPSIVARLEWAGQPLTLIVTHPLPPEQSGVRNAQLLDLGHRRDQFGKRLIVSGDLNTSPWSPVFQTLLQQARLRDSQMSNGIQPSWRVENWLIAIPIDHVLVSPEFKVIQRQIGPDFGSDHRPVIVDLALQ